MRIRRRSRGIRLHVACILLVGVLGQNVTGQNVTDPCKYTDFVQPARQIGVRPISISEIQAMIACKNCVCLVGLRSVGYRWIAGGWIYSKPVGWLVCLLVSVVWSDLWSVVGLPAGLFAIQSVGRLNHPAG